MLLDPPPAWKNQPLILYHGTTDAYARHILTSGVDVQLGSESSDFGRGFYTTTLLAQARSWAWTQTRPPVQARPAVVEFRVPREQLSRLETVSFVRGDHDAEDFWSLVIHCRSGYFGHGRPGDGYYDVAIGPVAAFWKQRFAMNGADQVSFHTAAAQAVLNASPKRRMEV